MGTPLPIWARIDDDLLRADACCRDGRWQDALPLYRAVLVEQPSRAEANHRMGWLAIQAQQPAAALPYLKAALQANRNHGGYWFIYIEALIQAGQREPALLMLAQARERGLAREAADTLQQHVGGATGNVPPRVGSAPDASEIAMLEILSRESRYAEMETRAGSLTMRCPDSGVAWKALGAAILQQNAGADAVEPLRLAAHYLPLDAAIHNNLGNALCDAGQYAEACGTYREALRLQPRYPLAHSNLLFALNFTAATTTDCLEEARRYGRMASELPTAAAPRFTTWTCEAEPRRLRVGVVSGDLCEHPVGHFLEGTLAHLDRESVELIAYPAHVRDDALSARLKPCFAAWKPIADLDDATAARAIHADGVHLLLDLSGHTAANRLPVFAWKPAPVLVSWLGYFATTGLVEMDYLVADRIGVPDAAQGQFSEEIFYLPDTRLCFTAPPAAPSPNAPPALANGFITFGSFQHMPKINDNVLAAWARILSTLPTARLRLQSRSLGLPAVQQQLAQRMARAGLDPARVRMSPPGDRAAYLGAHAEIDVILDTFPYPGGTTTCEALWMGVPTLTLAGDRLLSRQGASMLAVAGLPDWVATSVDDYVAKAIDLSEDVTALARLRGTLRPRVLASPLFDAPRFAAHFADALWKMWQQKNK